MFILLGVICSITVSVMLKLAKRYQIDVYQAIVWNYSAAILLCWALLRPKFGHLKAAPVGIYIALGFLLPAIFIVLSSSIRLSGIIRTEVAQRLSLLITVVAAGTLFGENIAWVKLLGIGIGLLAVILIILSKKEINKKASNAGAWPFLLLVFAGFGTIDILFKQVAAWKPVPYNTSLFFVLVFAFGFSFAGLVYMVATKKMRFSWPHIFIGWGLGVANFGNIWFYIKAHQALANKPSTVFSVVNIASIVAGALVGLIIFKEKLSLLNKIGIVIAIIAVIIIFNT